MVDPLIAIPGGWELVLILFVIVLLFGARKLPDLTRSVAQSLNIFKQETKGLRDDDSDKPGGASAADPDPRELPPARDAEGGTQGEAPGQRSTERPTERHDGTTG